MRKPRFTINGIVDLQYDGFCDRCLYHKDPDDPLYPDITMIFGDPTLVKDLEYTDDTMLKSFKVEGGHLSIETSGGAGHRLIIALANFYEANGGPNYFTMTFEGTVREKRKRYEITIRNLNGNKSPAETIKELKDEINHMKSEGIK